MRRPLLPLLILLPLCGIMALASLSPFANAEANWRQWRGPLGIGVSTAADPPVSWSEASNVRWKVKIPGSGNSTPIVWEDRIFIQTAVPKASAAPDQPRPG